MRVLAATALLPAVTCLGVCLPAGGVRAAVLENADFHVATTGRDDWSGTLPAPNAARTDGPFAADLATAGDVPAGATTSRNIAPGLREP